MRGPELDKTAPQKRAASQPPRKLSGRHSRLRLQLFAGAVIFALAGAASSAKATCWAGGDAGVRRLQDLADADPRTATEQIKQQLAKLRGGDPRAGEGRAWLQAVQAAALLNQGRSKEAGQAIGSALAASGRDSLLRSQILSLTPPLLASTSRDERLARIRELEALRAAVDARTAMAICASNALARLRHGLGETEAALTEAGEAYRAALTAGLDIQAGELAHTVATILFDAGDYERANEFALVFEKGAKRSGSSFFLMTAAGLRARIAAPSSPGLAAALYLEAAQLARQLKLSPAPAAQGACAALARLGKTAKALSACRMAEQALEPSDLEGRLTIGRLLGEIDLARGRTEEALARFDVLLALPLTAAQDFLVLPVLEQRARAYGALGQFGRANRDMARVIELSAAAMEAERARELGDARARFGWDRQRIAIANLQRDLAQVQARAQARHLWSWTSAAWAALLGAMLAWVLFSGQRHRRRLQAHADEARELARTKTELLSNMSHEIRSPLGSLTLAAARLAGSSEVPAEGRLRAARLGKAGEQLMILLDDLLFLSRIEARRLTITPATFDIRELVKELASSLAKKAAERAIVLTTKINGDVPRSVVGDRECTGQILSHLVRHAERRPGVSAITLSLSAAQEGQFVLAVTDNGELFCEGSADQPDRHLAAVGDRLARVQPEAGRAEQVAGRDVGLAIAKGLAELSGGSLVTKNDSAGGLLVLVTLPKDVAVQARLSPDTSSSSRVMEHAP